MVQKNQSKMNIICCICSYLANTAILNIRIFSSFCFDQFILLLFTLTSIPTCYNVNDTKIFKSVVLFHALCTQIICILQIGSLNATGVFKIILIQFCVLSDLIRRISNYMCEILLICNGQPTSFGKYKPVNIQSGSSKKNIC